MNIRGFVALAVLAPWALWAGVRVSGVALPYPVAPALAFTPWVALLSVLPVFVAVLLRQWRSVAAAAGVMILLVGAVIGRALPGEGKADAGGRGAETVRAMSINVLKGSVDPADVMGLVRRHRIDVLSVQESRPEWVAALDAVGGARWFRQRNQAVWDEALVSRLPMEDFAAADSILATASGVRVRVVAVHPPPPLNPVAWRRWRDELTLLPSAHQLGRTPTVLLGDFNATLDHPELRDVIARGYRDAADVVGAGLQTTWPAGRRFPPEITIDHVLVDRRLRVVSLDVVPIPRSDHRALIAVIRIR